MSRSARSRFVVAARDYAASIAAAARLIAVAGLIAGAAGCTRAPAPTASRGDDIVGGVANPVIPSAVCVGLPPNNACCSGSVISNRVVMTALHCLRGRRLNQINVRSGANANVAQGTPQIAFWPRDGADIATIVLNRNTTVAAIALRAVPINRGNCGNNVSLVGYGTQGRGGAANQQRNGPATIVQVGPPGLGPTEFRTRHVRLLAGNVPSAGACPGDSGGPAIGAVTGQQVGVMVRANCAGNTELVRVDPYNGGGGGNDIVTAAINWRNGNPLPPAPGGAARSLVVAADDTVPFSSTDLSDQPQGPSEDQLMTGFPDPGLPACQPDADMGPFTPDFGPPPPADFSIGRADFGPPPPPDFGFIRG